MPGDEPSPDDRTFRRELLFELPSASNLERSGDALIVRSVKLLAAGTWTDSAAKTPCSYGPDALREYAGNWADSSLWSRHAGGQPRTINQKVGRIESPRFEDDAVVGDLVLHGLPGTDSPGAIAMIEAGEADYFSAELTGTERWNAERKLYEMQSITFLGGAVVNRGACSTCTLRHNEAGAEPGESPAACATDDPTEDTMTAELEAKIAELETANADLVRQLGEAQETNTKIAADVDALRDELRELEGIKARLLKIEQTPMPKAGAPAEPARELTVPARWVTKNGEIYQEI
jgi:uncharacterized coiled-coil protein SlyX